MTAGRPIGERIRAICAHIERAGPMVVSDLLAVMPSEDRTNLAKYCSRAVGLGLLTVQRNTGVQKNSNLWDVNPGWRELIGQRRTTRTKLDQVPAKRTGWGGVSSVFGMGAM